MKVHVVLNSVIVIVFVAVLVSERLDGCSRLILHEKLIIVDALAMIYHRYVLRVLLEMGDNAAPIFVLG